MLREQEFSECAFLARGKHRGVNHRVQPIDSFIQAGFMGTQLRVSTAGSSSIYAYGLFRFEHSMFFWSFTGR